LENVLVSGIFIHSYNTVSLEKVPEGPGYAVIYYMIL